MHTDSRVMFAQKLETRRQTTSVASTISAHGRFRQSAEEPRFGQQRTIWDQAAPLEVETGDAKGGSSAPGNARFGHDLRRITVYPEAPLQTTGKWGSLPEEGPWEPMTGNGGPATPNPATGTTPKTTATTASPKLTKKTVSGPTAGDCGGFKWVCQWELDRNTTKGGWVVQKVELPYEVKDCSDKAVDPTKVGGLQPSWYPLWEAWQIHKGQKVTTYAEGGDTEDDTYANSGYSTSTKGSVTVKGTAEFYDGLTLPSAFKVTNKPPTGILPATKASPTLSGGTGGISHDLKATWDCCSKDKTTKIETV